jgi:hypothetical protein
MIAFSFDDVRVVLLLTQPTLSVGAEGLDVAAIAIASPSSLAFSNV